MRLTPLFVALVIVTATPAFAQTSTSKAIAIASVARQGGDLVALSDRVWEIAETALRETRSAEVLAAHAETQGFTVQRGVAGMPTAFVASYGQGAPVIASGIPAVRPPHVVDVVEATY
jgi:aminobenzoyl-glutamate utilization protein B